MHPAHAPGCASPPGKPAYSIWCADARNVIYIHALEEEVATLVHEVGHSGSLDHLPVDFQGDLYIMDPDGCQVSLLDNCHPATDQQCTAECNSYFREHFTLGEVFRMNFDVCSVYSTSPTVNCNTKTAAKDCPEVTEPFP